MVRLADEGEDDGATSTSNPPVSYQTSQGVTNLEGNQEAFHVKNVALFALAAVEAVAKIKVDDEDPKHGHAHLRVGFHSGKQW